MRGSIRQARPGVWRLVCDAGANGSDRRKQIYRTVYGTKQQAQKALNALTLEADERRAKLTTHKGSLGDLLDRYIAHKETRGASPNTITGYRKLVRQMPHDLLRTPLADLTARQLDEFYGERLNEYNNSANTVRHFHTLIKAALQQAIRWDMASTNVADRASPPTMHFEQQFIPTEKQVLALIVAAEESRNPEMAEAIKILVVTGMRRSELANLQWRDVDFTANTVFVRKSKTYKSRTIAVHTSLFEPRRERAGDVKPTDPVFPYQIHTYTQFIGRLADRIGMPELTTHALRRFAATSLISAGHDVVSVAHRLGHDPTMLLRVYAGAVAENDRRAGEVMGQILAGAIPLEGGDS